MLNPDSSCRIYLCTGHTDMRKGVHSLSIVAQTIISDNFKVGALFVFRGKSADKIKNNMVGETGVLLILQAAR